MKFKLIFLSIICFSLTSCKLNFSGKQFQYSNNFEEEFKMIFVNDKILKIQSSSGDKATYTYYYLEKNVLKKIKKDQPTKNPKTRKVYGQFQQKIVINNINGSNKYFDKIDTLHFLKLREANGQMIKRIYFDNGNKYINTKR